ncbi:MAG: site-specific integrase [Nitriliruptorales bacterium]|nr:site-specific integrase [Nitriliruptorales bacterium]
MATNLPLVGRYLDHLTVERGLSEHTIAAYRRDLSRYAEYLAERGIADPRDAETEDVEQYVVWLRQQQSADGQPYAASSVARMVVAVRGLHRFLAREGLSDHDVAAEVATPTASRPLP